jgi:hypothetical protein
MLKILSAAAIGGVLFITSLTGAGAAPNNTVQDGLVNVAAGDVTILQDVNAAVAAQVIANVCGLEVGPIAVLANQVDAGDPTATFCDANGSTMKITQNTGGPGGGPGGPNSARQSGLVNVALGDVTLLQNVNVGVAAQAVANICGVKVGPIAALANQLNAGEATTTICEAGGAPVRIIQS